MLKPAAVLSLAKINKTMSEASSQRFEDKRVDGIDFLAERVTEAVKMEVLRFFHRGEEQ